MAGSDAQAELAIVTTVKDLGAKKLAQIGKEGEMAGKRVKSAMAEVEQGSKRSVKEMLEISPAASKVTSVAGAGFSAMAAGIAASQASAQNLEASMISVGAAVAASFAAGGPVGAGIALLTTGLGLLIGKAKEVDTTLRDMAQAAGKVAESGRAAAAQIAATVREMDVAFSAEDAGIDPRRAVDQDRAKRAIEDATKALREQEKALAKLDAEREKARDLDRAFQSTGYMEGQVGRMEEKIVAAQKEARAAVTDAIREQREYIAQAETMLGRLADRWTRDDVAAAAENLRDAGAAIRDGAEGIERSVGGQVSSGLAAAASAAAQLRSEIESASNAERSRYEALSASVETRERIASLSDRDRAYAADILRIEDLRRDGYSDLADRLQQVLDVERERAEVAQQVGDIVSAALESQNAIWAGVQKLRAEEEARLRSMDQIKSRLRDELEDLNAANRFERERIRIRRELDQILKGPSDEETRRLAQERAAKKLADLAKQEREEKERAAKAEQDKAQAAREGATATRQAIRNADVTQRFASVGGNKFGFGFGAGRVGRGLSLGDHVTRPSADGGDVPDPTPEAREAVQRQQEANQKLAQLKIEIKKQEIEIRQAIKVTAATSDDAAAVAKGISQMVDELHKLKASFESMQKAAKKAGRIGVGP